MGRRGCVDFYHVLSIALALVAAGWLGCATFDIQTDYDPSVDFTAFKTYAWQPEPENKTGDPRTHNDLVDGRVRTAIEQELALKGYQNVSLDAADFHVNYHVGIETKLNVHTIHGYHGYGYGGWYGGYPAETVVNEYEEGTLLLDFLQPESHQLFWRGSASALISENVTPEKREEKVRAAVKQILERFPPGPTVE